MAQMTGFKVFKGTKQEFINSGKATANANAIVFITGGSDASASCIFAQGTYFANIVELMQGINYVKGINVSGSNYDVVKGGGYVAFSANDPATVAVNAGSNGVQIGLTDAFKNRVSTLETNVGSASDSANKTGSVYARIANLAELVGQLTGDEDGGESISSQINSAIDALRTEIVGTLDTADAKTLQAVNDELDSLGQSITNLQNAGHITISDVQSYVGGLKGQQGDGDLVDISVSTEGGVVTSVSVVEDGLNNALAGKADLSNGKILLTQLPDSILGQVMFGGTITTNSVATLSANFKAKYGVTANTLTLKASDASTYEGVYFIANGSLSNATIIGVSDVNVGDWVISTGADWQKVDNTDAVSSVAGLNGAIDAGALAGELSKSGITNTLATKAELDDAVDFQANGDANVTLSYDKGTRAFQVTSTDALKSAVTKANSAYQKPSTGIALSDLASGIQTSLGKADDAAPQSTTYTKTEVNNKLTNHYTKTEVYTKEEVDAMFAWEEL